jgi:predicted adenylyl cyclase CyaB
MDVNSTPPACNVELKARLDKRETAIETCRRLGAVDQGTIEQTDTYFTLGRHRLKLREQSDGKAWLIGYSRPDRPEARRSQYRLEPVENPGALKATLGRQWGVKVVVRKSRRWFLWEGRVRVHLDRVETLGDFLEFEAVVGAVPGYDENAALLDVARLQHDFSITARDLVSTSYASLVKNADTTPAGT